MDPEIDIKEEPVWLEETITKSFDSHVNNTVDDDHVLKVEPPTSVFPKVEDGTLGPRTEDDMTMPPADVKYEIFIEQHSIGQLVPCFKKEDKVQNVEVRTSSPVQMHVGYCKAFNTRNTPECRLGSPTEDGSYCCKICKCMFTRQGDLENHLLIHFGQQPNRCFVCNTAFPVDSDLESHLLTHFKKSTPSGEHPYHCNICSRTFYSKYRLNNHMRTHSVHRLIYCDICRLFSSQKCNRVTHMSTHSDECLFTCDICKKSFSRKSYIKRHLLKHTTKRVH